MSRELTERGVGQGTGRKLTHHMLRRMVTHRVYLDVAYHSITSTRRPSGAHRPKGSRR
jgi:hypothetical protein